MVKSTLVDAPYFPAGRLLRAFSFLFRAHITNGGTMKKAILAVNIVLCALLVLFFALSVADTEEVTRKTEMDTSAISRHIEKLSENGPRSLFHPEANEAARDYIVSALEESGLVNEDTTKAPAYQVRRTTRNIRTSISPTSSRTSPPTASIPRGRPSSSWRTTTPCRWGRVLPTTAFPSPPCSKP